MLVCVDKLCSLDRKSDYWHLPSSYDRDNWIYFCENVQNLCCLQPNMNLKMV